MFNKYPVNPVRNIQADLEIGDGFDPIAGMVMRGLDSLSDLDVVVVDGTNGAPFGTWAAFISHALERENVQVEVVNTDNYLKSGPELRALFKDNITDNRAFGYMTEGDISDYFQENAQGLLAERLEEIRLRLRGTKALILICGVGAHWLSGESGKMKLFLDLSREYQQVLHKRELLNFGFDWNEDALEKYKIAFFVEWPILEGYRKRKLTDFDYYVDANRDHQPVMISLDTLLAAVDDMVRYPIRVKPFFAPGIWGGQYLKQLADLPEEWPNCAWSFEPIAPENSVLIGLGQVVAELPFLVVMDYGYKQIMGERPVSLFGDYFPIRFDYLDTIGGTNLSVQVHPKQEYVRDHFNYILEQQESYYIMEKQGDSKVYLGLTESCSKEAFLEAVEQSQQTGEPIPYTDYVQEWDCRKGDLFLIPTGTVHCSGSDNLVLEISATTWWLTMKIYDYARKDADGKPRPINIDHAMPNVDWHKKPEWVREQLISSPRLVSQQGSNEEYELGKREDLLFYVNRIHLQDRWTDHTNDELMLLNLVEGERIRIRSMVNADVFVELSYAESFILPAVFGEFVIENIGLEPCKIIKTGVSPDWNVRIAYE